MVVNVITTIKHLMLHHVHKETENSENGNKKAGSEVPAHLF